MSSSFEIGRHMRVELKDKKPHTLQFHLDRNLQDLEGDNIFSYTRFFIKNCQEDFRELAKILEERQDLSEIDEISGVAAFPEKLGKRYGFKSTPLSYNPKLIERYKRETPKKTLKDNTDRTSELRHFTTSRKDFLESYLLPTDSNSI